MPASITLSRLSWSTPDGRTLFSDIDLAFSSERAGLIGRNGVGKSTLLRLITGELYPQAGTIVSDGTLGVLRQTLQVDPQATVADLFGTGRALALLRRAEAGEATIDELASADWTLEARMADCLARFGLDAVSGSAVASLSGGQRTRVGLAALVFAEPDFLILDEPTNNLDRDGRRAVIDLLANWRGGAIIVSHDRELLEAMDAIVELTSTGATRHGGNWSLYRERKAIEVATAERALADAEKRVAEATRSARITAERQARRDRGGRARAAGGDMPNILAGTLKMRAQNTAGASNRLAERQREKAQSDIAAARQRFEVLQPLSARIAPTGLPAGKTVLRLRDVTGGHDTTHPVIGNLSFELVGPERLAITGPNGSGKTTLLSLVSGRLAPWSGEVSVLTPFALLDQAVNLLDPRSSIRDNFMRINPQAAENDCRAALARFMFRAEAALQMVSTLSGGQMLRAGLACVLGGPTPPKLLILDEPTNHLDLDSIAAVEAGLRSYDGALLVVSHDDVFLREIGISRRIELCLPPV